MRKSINELTHLRINDAVCGLNRATAQKGLYIEKLLMNAIKEEERRYNLKENNKNENQKD